ncbi:MAG TPA: Fe-S cluster assembly protein SufD [Vicinamibacterales bacterium]|nr:Fe-S cluster assembly protein SufD [Vicinamibacterales bacterium]
MATVAERQSTFTAAFDALRRDAAFAADPARNAREAAFARVTDRGFPSTRDEEWRFTSVAPIVQGGFAPAARPAAIDRAAADGLAIPGATQLLLVNGQLQGTPALPAGVSLRHGDIPAVPSVATVFADLNTVFHPHAVILEIAPRAVVDAVLHIIHVAVSADGPTMASPRLVINAGEQSQATVIETYADLGTRPAFTNAVTQVNVGGGAILHHVKIERGQASAFHLASTFAHVERAGTFDSRALTFGGRIVRNDIVATLDGEGATCTLDGLYVGTGETLIDTHTTIDHAKAHCPSHEVYKGILGGRARAVFNGKIIVRQDAQKTDAKQTNKALLLTDDAQINTKPQLEIFADDVKCTHGAAIGQLDEDAMFYMRARGIDVDAARNMLIHAFAGQVLDGIQSDAVRDLAVRLMEEKLNLAHQV